MDTTRRVCGAACLEMEAERFERDSAPSNGAGCFSHPVSSLFELNALEGSAPERKKMPLD